MFNKFINRYIIRGQLTAQTALHIGAAKNEFRPNGCKNPFFRNADGLPLIPGSSLKGVMRSFLEQYLPEVCDPENPCVDSENNKEFETLLKEKDNGKKLSYYLFGNEKEKGKLCVVCRLFGSKYSAAKFNVRDAKVIEDTFQREFEIRSGVSIDRELGTKVQSKYFETEVVPEGTAFSFQAILENAEKSEWDIIKQLLRAMETGLISIGGMKSRGLGEIRLENIEYQYIDKNNFIDYISGNEIQYLNLSNEEGK